MTMFAIFSRETDDISYGVNNHIEYPWTYRATCPSEDAAKSWVESNRNSRLQYSIRAFEAEGLVQST